MSEVTRILNALAEGAPNAADELLPLVYSELRQLAARKLAREKPGQTLQPTALVHEAYLRLVGADTRARWSGKGHFFAAAAEAIRRILIDQTRRKHGLRHGGGMRRRDLREEDLLALPNSADVIDLDQALTKFAKVDPEAADIVKMRVFAGMTVEEIAAVQDSSARTVKRHWAYARAWLGRELADHAQQAR